MIIEIQILGDEYLSEENSVIDNLDDSIYKKRLESTLEIIKDKDAFKYIYVKSVEPDFKVVEKKAREAQDPDTLRADMNMLNGTFYYEAAEDMLTLRNPDSGDQIVFEKAH